MRNSNRRAERVMNKQEIIEVIATAIAEAINSDGKVDCDNVISAEIAYAVMQPLLHEGKK